MPSRYEQLATWINQNRWAHGAELGLFDGRTYLHLLQSCPSLKVLYGVDVWGRPTPQGATTSGERCVCAYCNETRASRRSRTIEKMEEDVKLGAAGHGGRARIMTMPTWEAAQLIEPESLDFVFIDADHSFEGVSADIMNWRPKVKPGGWIIGHDYNMASVKAAVQKHLSKWPAAYDDHVWVWNAEMRPPARVAS